eukprot:SAG31_NODE_2912_length_4920_cov_3.413192_3_plen_479_part_00
MRKTVGCQRVRLHFIPQQTECDVSLSGTGVTWDLFTYKESFPSISPNKWSADDTSAETQVTIVRHPQRTSDTSIWPHWSTAYSKCKQVTSSIIEHAVSTGKLSGRPGQKQFEIFSADYMLDTHGKVWLFEFNMTPALCQHSFAMRDDEEMIRDALSLVLPWEGSTAPGNWDGAGQFVCACAAALPISDLASRGAALLDVVERGTPATDQELADRRDWLLDVLAAEQTKLGPAAVYCMPCAASQQQLDRTKQLFCWTVDGGWAVAGDGLWNEVHGPLPCCDWRSSWPPMLAPSWVTDRYGGNSATAAKCTESVWHTVSTSFDEDKLHAVWTPSKSSACRGIVLLCPGTGTGAGPGGSFGPFCLFTRLADALSNSGIAVIRVVNTAWAQGKLPAMISAVRCTAALAKVLCTSTFGDESAGAPPMVLVGWSMGGAAVIEAGGRWAGDDLPALGGVITLASQSAGVFEAGNILHGPNRYGNL